MTLNSAAENNMASCPLLQPRTTIRPGLRAWADPKRLINGGAGSLNPSDLDFPGIVFPKLQQ